MHAAPISHRDCPAKFRSHKHRVLQKIPGRTVIGRPVEDGAEALLGMVHSEDRLATAAMLARAAGGEAVEHEWRLRRADGAVVRLWAETRPETDASGRVVAIRMPSRASANGDTAEAPACPEVVEDRPAVPDRGRVPDPRLATSPQ